MQTETQTQSTLTIRPASREGLARATNILLGAFADDPAVRAMYPDLRQYLDGFPSFIEAFAGRAFDHGTAFFVEPDRGVALWFSPGVQPDEEAVETVLERTVAPDRLAVMQEVFAQMNHYHPREPHWYLPLMGVSRPYRGQGFGSALLGHVLSVCDRQGLPAYLEATTRRNAGLYRRFGFEPIGRIEADGFPTLLPMIRPVASG
jgi:GNAT superfamily N-acetyltransferase